MQVMRVVGLLIMLTVFCHKGNTQLDRIEFGFTLQQYEGLEGSGFIEVTIEKSRRLATPVTMIVTPLTVTRAAEENARNGRPLPPNLNEGDNADDDPLSPNRAKESDFNTQPISVTFEADGTGAARNRRSIRIGVTMDNINEARTEIFVAILEVGNTQLNRALISNTGIRAAICRISDDDEIELGYEFATYTFDEPSRGSTDAITYEDVRIIKSVVTEQTLIYGIVVSPIEATQQTDIATNDFSIDGLSRNFILRSFNPNDQKQTIQVDIFPDTIQESIERFRLGISVPSAGDPEYLTSVNLIGTTTVFIRDSSHIVIECPALPQLVNGVITYAPDNRPDFDVGTVATHECNSGFALMGVMTRTCESGAVGTWSNQPSTCVPIECPALPQFDNGMITYAPDNTPDYNLGTVATHECNQGFFLVGAITRICEGDESSAVGRWSGIAPSCDAIQCPALPQLVSGVIMYAIDNTPDFDLGTVATYSCISGFALVGARTRTCEGDGSSVVGMWSDLPPTCVFIQCPDLESLENGEITYAPDNTPDYDFGTVATHECNEEFALMGAATRTCEGDGSSVIGRWSGKAPTCVFVQCPDLDPLENGMITYAPDSTPDYDSGTVAIHMCNEGFVLIGTMTRVCEGDGSSVIGTWSDELPACVERNILECAVGTYRERLSNQETACVPCPDNSISTVIDSRECVCFDGYYRTGLEGPNFACTAPPSACRNLQVFEERTRGNTITVHWERPEITGRDDFYYNIFYSEDNQTFTQHNPRPYMKQDTLVDYSLSGLRPLTTYTIRVTAENGVSNQDEGGERRSCQVTGTTGDTRANAPSLAYGGCTVVVWTAPTRTYGVVTGYDVNFVSPSDNMTVTTGRRQLFYLIRDEDLANPVNTLVQVRAKTSAADGRWSEFILLGCSEQPSPCP